MPKLTRFGVWMVLAVLLAVTAVSAQIPLDSLQRRFNDQRFGMFLHFNMNTFVSGWGNARTNPLNFNPTNLDCAQWASAAVSAKMKWAVLTCKHHDGFVIWQSNVSKNSPLVTPAYTIAQSSQPTMDVAKSYTDAFRAAGVMPGLYLSGWDVAQNIPRNLANMSAAQHNYILGQIKELCTNYGEVPIFWFDGYSWAFGHHVLPIRDVRDTIKKYQPNCVIVETNGMYEPWECDILFFEQPLGISCPATNTFASCQADYIANDWFWTSNCTNIANLKSAASVVSNLTTLNSHYCSFLFDCPPNRAGQLDAAVVQRLGEIGAAWTPPARLRLQTQVPMIERPITIVTATSGNGSNCYNAYDDVEDYGGSYFQQIWTSATGLPQWISLDLGKVYDSIIYLFYLPRRESGNTTGNITGYQLHYSTDNANWTQITSGTAIGGGGSFGTWPNTSVVKKVQFAPVSARYIRLTATAANGATYMVINELAVGTGPRYLTAVKKNESVRPALLAPGWSIRTALRYVDLDRSLAGKMKTVSVYTLGGKLVGMARTNKNSIDLRKDCGVPEGVYIVKAALAQGK